MLAFELFHFDLELLLKSLLVAEMLILPFRHPGLNVREVALKLCKVILEILDLLVDGIDLLLFSVCGLLFAHCIPCIALREVADTLSVVLG